MSELEIKYKNKTVKTIIENGIVNSTWSFLDKSKRYIVITDNNLVKCYHKLLKTIPNGISVLTIKSGNNSKSLAIYEKIVKNLINLNVTQNDVLISFGGGVVGDLTGFIAGTYLNGIEYIQIPTSLIAQIDSSIGGKCSLNLNDEPYISIINHPSKIIVDPNLLNTLPDDEFYNGISEIIKYSVIKDIKLFNILTKEKITKESTNLIDIISTCINIKTSIIQKDEQRSFTSKVLNFGYLHYNAIKKSNNKLTHKDILSMGMYYELYEELKPKLLNVLEMYELNTKLNEMPNTKNLEKNKSNFQNKIIVKVDKIGHTIFTEN